MEHLFKPCTGNGTFELGYGIAAKSISRTAADTMEKRQSTRALQQRIQSKRDISDVARSKFRSSLKTTFLVFFQ
jgi:hypothetical protein